MSRLRITEIFYSLQGESTTVGLPTVFIRLTGCPLRCTYCDTAYAFHGGQWFEFDEILTQVAEYHPRYITVTGGEPLAQPDCIPLLTTLGDAGYSVSLETSGALDISAVDPRVMIVMDLKTPASGEAQRNRLENLDHLKQSDQIKFVISGLDDYEWSKSMIRQHKLAERCQLLFSPEHGSQSPRELADWILRDRLQVRLQIQLHKFLWGNEPGK